MIVYQHNTRDEWLAARQDSIGGSDAAAAIGAGQWPSRLTLWAHKRQLIPPLEDTPAMRAGRKLEAVVLEFLAEDAGRAVAPWPPFSICRCEEFPVMSCTPDATQDAVLDCYGFDGPGIVQAKTCGHWTAETWNGEPPLSAQIQLQHELAVTGYQWGTLCVLIAGQEFKYYDIPRNERFIRTLREVETEFWESYVATGIEPPADGTETTTKTWAALHPHDDGKTVFLPPDAAAWAHDLEAAKVQIAIATKAKRLAENRLKQAIGDSSFGALPNGDLYSLLTSKAGHRTLRRKATR